MQRQYMDRTFNGFNKFNHSNAGRGYAREYPNEEGFRPRKFNRYGSGSRYQLGRDNFRDNFRGNMQNLKGMRENLPKENIHEKHVDRDEDGKDGYTEKFHERQVNYHKNVHTKQSDDDLREDRDDLRRGRDMIRGKGRGYQGDFRR